MAWCQTVLLMFKMRLFVYLQKDSEQLTILHSHIFRGQMELLKDWVKIFYVLHAQFSPNYNFTTTNGLNLSHFFKVLSTTLLPLNETTWLQLLLSMVLLRRHPFQLSFEASIRNLFLSPSTTWKILQHFKPHRLHGATSPDGSNSRPIRTWTHASKS